MIQTLPCPSCETVTLLRQPLSPEARIRCPHCQTEFVIQDLLASHFGFWEVIEDPGSLPLATVAMASGNLPEGATHDFALADDAADDFEPASQEIADRVDHAEAAQRLELRLQEPTTEPLKKSTDWSNFQPITHDQYERLKRKSRSPLWSVIQVVLGGVAAVPIALLLVWHLVGTDVADAGPLVGKYVPWIVPERFRPLPEVAEVPATVAATAPQRGASGFRQFDDVLPPKVSESDSTDTNHAATTENTTKPRSATDALSPSVTANSQPTANPPADSTEVEPLMLDAELQPAPVRNVFALIQQCQQHLDEWSAAVRAEGSDLKTPAQRVYSDLTSLATVIDALPSQNPVLRVIRNEMQPIGKTVKRLPDVQALIDQGARYWVRSHAASEIYGLAMIVTLEDVEETPRGWQLTATPESSLGDPALQIEVPGELAPMLMAGQRLLLLGVVRPAVEPEPSSVSSVGGTSAADSSSQQTQSAVDDETSSAVAQEQVPGEQAQEQVQERAPEEQAQEQAQGEPAPEVASDAAAQPAANSAPKGAPAAPKGPRFVASYLHAM